MPNIFFGRGSIHRVYDLKVPCFLFTHLLHGIIHCTHIPASQNTNQAPNEKHAPPLHKNPRPKTREHPSQPPTRHTKSQPPHSQNINRPVHPSQPTPPPTHQIRRARPAPATCPSLRRSGGCTSSWPRGRRRPRPRPNHPTTRRRRGSSSSRRQTPVPRAMAVGRRRGRCLLGRRRLRRRVRRWGARRRRRGGRWASG